MRLKMPCKRNRNKRREFGSDIDDFGFDNVIGDGVFFGR